MGWRGAYWVMTGWHGFGLLCLFFFYHPPKFSTKHGEDHISKWTLLAELDYVGLLFFTAGTTLFLVGLNFGGRQYEWASAAVIAPIVIGFLCLVALFAWIFMVPMKYPLLPPKLFRQWRGYVRNILSSFLARCDSDAVIGITCWLSSASVSACCITACRFYGHASPRCYSRLRISRS